jgi:hypothetical protein
MNIGITGHQRLKNPSAWTEVRTRLGKLLDDAEKPLIGLTSLAIGADQLFAEAVLGCGGKIEAIIPFDGYEMKFNEGPDREAFRRLLELASRIETLERQGTDEDAYLAAGKRIVDLCDRMIAVWDGQPAAGIGGTGDIVNYCKSQNKPVELIPIDASSR